MIDLNAVLCLVKDGAAYFTTAWLEDQRGDDWNDVPVYSNAGSPYEKNGHIIYKVYFEVEGDTPGNGPYWDYFSANDINRGLVPWVIPWRKESKPIMAGTSYQDFVRYIQEAGGIIYEPVDRLCL